PSTTTKAAGAIANNSMDSSSPTRSRKRSSKPGRPATPSASDRSRMAPSGSRSTSEVPPDADDRDYDLTDRREPDRNAGVQRQQLPRSQPPDRAGARPRHKRAAHR